MIFRSTTTRSRNRRNISPATEPQGVFQRDDRRVVVSEYGGADQAIRVWGKEADRHGLVNVAHVGCNSLPDAQELVRAAEATGAAAISAMAPTFFKPTDEAALCPGLSR